ncbi:MAG: nucleoside phosphorylase [Proteobacteria bacterium]|nr:nucleoside phosphorylase [Pseudomonadota bacterium]MBU1714172.1 nucleoside phosphorylase [Pseudomonadota bacterium]
MPSCGLLCVNPSEAEYLRKLVNGLSAKEYFLFNSRLLVVPATGNFDAFFCAGPAVGAAMAVLALEKLIALGARQILIYGWCGSLSPDLKIGDLLVPFEGISEEGTSPHYPLAEKAQVNVDIRYDLITMLSEKGYAALEGSVWTTDALYRETREKVALYADQGVRGVDMEFTALLTVAAYRGVDLSAVMLVSDELWHADWRPGFKDGSFRKHSRELVRTMVEYCRDRR